MTRQYLLIFTLCLTACTPTTPGNGPPKAEDSGEEPVADCEDETKDTYYEDLDGDGFGNPERPELLCGAEDGWVGNSEDCDDSNGEVSPSQEEQCDGFDNNCDGMVDDDTAIDASDWFRDDDGDGYGGGPPRGFGCSGAEDEVNNSGDCDDADSAIHPDAIEVCDGTDNDCDLGIDNGETPDGHAVYEDLDADGWGNGDSELVRCVTPEDWIDRSGDCDDEDEAKNPDATDECDGSDMDCDGHIDSHCSTTTAAEDGWSLNLGEGAVVVSMHISDMDGDGTRDLLAFDIENSEALFFSGPLSDGDLTPDLTIAHGEPSDGSTPPTHTAFGLAIQGEVDFNGDGHPDLLISAPGSVSDSEANMNSVGLFLGPDWLEMDPSAPYAVLTSSLSMTTWGTRDLPAGDLTGDGQMDALITSSEGTMVIWENPLEDAMVDDLAILDTPGRAENMIPAIGDVNADGQADLVVSTGEMLAIRHGPISASALASVADLAISAPSDTLLGDGLCIADLTGDGAIDLAYTETLVPGSDGEVDKVHVMDLTLDESSPFWTAEFSATGPTTVLRCDDVDGDGRADLQVNDYFNSDVHYLGGKVHIFFGTLDSGVITPDQRFDGTADEGAIGLGSASGDLDGDGIGDLVLSGLTSTLYVHAGSGWVSDAWSAAD
jgi:hypothetical protein